MDSGAEPVADEEARAAARRQASRVQRHSIVLGLVTTAATLLLP